MNLNPDQYALDCENYRIANGKAALFTYMRRKDGKLWVVKKQTADEVVLHGVFQDCDLTVSSDEFATDFQMAIQDEAVFFFGSKAQQESARKLFEAECEAVKRCLYGKAQLPVVACAINQEKDSEHDKHRSRSASHPELSLAD